MENESTIMGNEVYNTRFSVSFFLPCSEREVKKEEVWKKIFLWQKIMKFQNNPLVSH